MEFIDNTGHIFSLPSYEDNPISLQYTENDYIFWMTDSTVSIKNYYIKPVRFIISYETVNSNIDNFNLDVYAESGFYQLISQKYLQTKLEQNNDISESVGLDKSQFVNHLTLEDFYFSKENELDSIIVTSGNSDRKFYLFSFYVVGTSEIEGTFLNNIMIKYSYNDNITKTITKKLSKEEYYDYILKKAISPINIYKWDENNGQFSNKTLVMTINPTYNTEIINDNGNPNPINVGLNRYEILYNGDGVDDPNNPISENVLSSLYGDDDPRQAQQKNRIRSTIYAGRPVVGQLPVEEYIYIYKLDHVLPQGYYTFEGEFYEAQSVLRLTRLPMPYMGFNHEGYRNSTGQDSLYPEDANKINFIDKFQCGTLEILNQSVVDHKDNYITQENDIVRYAGYYISDIEHLNTPIEYPEIRDFWFMFISKEINEGKNGKTVNDYTQTITNNYNNYTPITVGCSFIDECEELIINGKNMGIRLPKEILKAIYNSSFYTKYADEKLLKTKLKEILLNYMNIKGETGNMKSLINSLKWFGWSNHITINQLIKTDNNFQNQFILDNFSITSDIKDTFKYFNKTNNISLSVLYNTETGENYEQDFGQTLIGEGKPMLENLFDKTIEVVKNDIVFYKPYYNFVFNELALKLDCLKYYYQQYFLPIHVNINRASIDYKVYANTTKMSSVGFTSITDSPVYLPNNSNNIKVVFPDTNRLIFMQSQHLIDSKYNEFSNYTNTFDDEDLYYVNENCITIPIRIEDTTIEYIKDIQGNYIIDNDEYVKINYFYKHDISGYELVKKISEATYYSFELYKDIKPLEDNRYIKRSKLYSKYEYGDYFIDENGEYVKMNFFYKIIDENTAKLSNNIEATHFSIEKNEDIQKLTDYVGNRYLKISEGYFNCKIILTSTSFKQNDEGHYVYIDGKYIYRKNFYTKKFSNDDEINDMYISNSGNYIKYNDDFINIDTKNRYDIETNYLINNDNFIYYQSGDQYYSNLVVIPRLLNNYIDWENSHYRLSMLVNNKWFTYDFDIVVPNIYLDLGKLEYKYDIISGDKTYYPFRQLKSLSNNNVEFNSFIFEPNLITIDALFKDENDKVLTFIDKLLETGIYDNNDGHLVSVSEMKMYDFYKKYYSNILKIPYNKKYYNKIHLFDIYIKNDLTVQHFITTHNNTFKYIIFRFNKPFNNYNIYGYFREESDRELGNAYINTTDTYYWDNMDNTGQYYISLALSYISAYVQDNSIKCEKIYIEYENGIKIEFSPTYKNNNLYVNVKGEKLKYLGINKDVELYKTFFNDNCTTKLNINEFIIYDTYLMHDDKEWYLVFISQYPIASYVDESVLNIQTTKYNLNSYDVIYSNYSVDKFLVNRMNIIQSNGLNQFNRDDLVIVGINNNDYQFNIDLNNRWSINKIYDVNSVFKIVSNTNLTIIPNNNIDNLYSVGYYNVALNYTINGLNNNEHQAIAQYRILDKYQDIKYPEIVEPVVEEETFDINDTISDFSILYESESGQRYVTKEILEPDRGYFPIGIKIMNKYYYGPQQNKSIYIGLKNLSVSNPDNGWAGRGAQMSADIPYFGFYGIDIPTLQNFDKICYSDSTHRQKITHGYPQTDYPLTNLLDGEGNWKYPADSRGRRGFWYDPSKPITQQNYVNINMLNDDDTLNWDVLDETCAASDWDGHANTLKIIEAFSPQFDGWKTAGIITNEKYSRFSPMAACAWRYHTKTTNQGDWYVPSFAEVFFLSYNAKRLTDLFAEIAAKYPQHCKPDLLTSLDIRNGYGAYTALWTTTESSSNYVWEIHVAGHAHELGKTTLWASFPYIQIKD